MAKYIIDTHALIWFLLNPKLLGPEAKKRLKDPKSEFYVLTNVLEEVRLKFEKFKIDNKDKGAIKIPAIICWRILKKSNNVKIRRLANKESQSPISKKLVLAKFKKDDEPFVKKYLILKEKYPKTEVEIITDDYILRHSELIRTCW